jgi:hypothetical protein
MTMGFGHAEAIDRLFFEVEFDQDDGLDAHDPSIVSRLDDHNLRGPVFEHTAVRVLDVDLAARQESDVRVHAQGRADDGLHVDRPAESGRIYHALDARGAGASNVEADVADFAPLGPFDGGDERIRRLRPDAARRASPRRRGSLSSGLSGGFPVSGLLVRGFLFCHALLTAVSGTADANTRSRYGQPENRQLDIRDETFAVLDEHTHPDWAIVNFTGPGTRQLPLSLETAEFFDEFDESWKLPRGPSRQ